MNRREFSLSSLFVGGSAALAVLPSFAQPAVALKQGKNFIKLPNPLNTNAPAGKIEVVEFFWYFCDHCFNFEPSFDRWERSASKDVVVRRIPIAFDKSDMFVPLQKLYFSLEKMGLIDRYHGSIFSAAKKNKKAFTTEKGIVEWVKSQKINEQEFTNLFNSFAIANAVLQATQLQNDYQVNGVPAIGVAGQYLTDGSLSGSLNGMLTVADLLIDQERNKIK